MSHISFTHTRNSYGKWHLVLMASNTQSHVYACVWVRVFVYVHTHTHVYCFRLILINEIYILNEWFWHHQSDMEENGLIGAGFVDRFLCEQRTLCEQTTQFCGSSIVDTFTAMNVIWTWYVCFSHQWLIACWVWVLRQYVCMGFVLHL